MHGLDSLILYKRLKDTNIRKLKYEEYVTMTVWEEWRAPSERRL